MRKAEVEVKKKHMNKRRLMLASAVALPVLLFALLTDHGLIKRMSLEFEHDDLKAQLEIEQQRTDSLQRQIESLTSDTTLIEKLAREKYGMLRPGEKAYIIERESD